MAGRSEDDAEDLASDSDAGADSGADVDRTPQSRREVDGPPGPDGGAGNGDADGAGEDWRFGVDDVGEDGVVQSVIEAENPDLEHAAFVVLGALAMVLVFVHLWTLV